MACDWQTDRQTDEQTEAMLTVAHYGTGHIIGAMIRNWSF